MNDWASVLVAAIAGAPATIAAIGALWATLRNSNKLDVNTSITKEGALASSVSARVAAESANSTEGKIDELKTQLNGALEAKIRVVVEEVVERVHKAMVEHSIQDEKNMEEIRGIVQTNTERIARHAERNWEQSEQYKKHLKEMASKLGLKE